MLEEALFIFNLCSELRNNGVESSWAAVKELELSYHNGYIGFRVAIIGIYSK